MKKNKGFTLVELLAVIIILGILVAIAIPVYINITRHTKENEYEAKKKYIAEAAVRYAEENSTMASEVITDANGNIVSQTSNKSLIFTGAKLVGMGYLSADRYDQYNGTEIPFIVNPAKDEDNLACHVISLTVENYTYYAEVSDTDIDCNLSSQEVFDKRLGIKAYEIVNNKASGSGFYSGADNVFKWVKNDVVLIINPQDDFEAIKILKPDKNTVDVNKNNMFKGDANGKSVDELQKYSNVIIIRSNTVSKALVEYTIETKNGEGNLETKHVSTTVRIDKEAPHILDKKFDGWVNKNKETLVYVNDNEGSGSAYVEYYNSKGQKVTANVIQGTNTAKLTDLTNGDHKVIAVDKVGNRSKEYIINIKMIDDVKPKEVKREWIIDSDISCANDGKQCSNPNNTNCGCRKPNTDSRIAYDRSRTLRVTFRDGESGVGSVKYCTTTNDGGCEPNITVNNATTYFDVKWKSNRESGKVCYYAIDNVDNRTDTICTDKYYVDGTGAYVLDYKYDWERTVNLSFKDDESGVFKYIVEAKTAGDPTTHRCESERHSLSEFYSTDMYSCLMPYLYANKLYKLEIKMINRSGIEQKITDRTLDTSKYNMTTAYRFCDPSNNWCTSGQFYSRGVYVNYKDTGGGDNVFLIYKDADNSVYGVNTKINENYSLINQTCCDHDKCHANYITSDASGIWGSAGIEYAGYAPMSAKFNRFPRNRTVVANQVKFSFKTIEQSGLELLKDKHFWFMPKVRNIDFSDIESLDSIGLVARYIYHFPNYNDDSTTCNYTYKGKTYEIKGRDEDLREKDGVLNTTGFDKGSYGFSCTRVRTEEAIIGEARQKYYEKTGKVYDENDANAVSIFNEIKNGVSKTDTVEINNVTLSITDPGDEDDISYMPTYSAPVHSYNDHLSTRDSGYSITAPFGIMSYDDYARLKTVPYFSNIPGTNGQGIQSLLLLYVDSVVYKSVFDSDLENRVYGHDGIYSTISAIVGRGAGGGYSATTPMRFGKYNAAMVIPFNKATHFSDGNGTPEAPFVVDSNWWG